MRPIVDLYSAAGAKQTPAANVFTLANATTYYAELTEYVDARTGFSLHYLYNAALVASITVEVSNRDRDVSSYAAVGSGWATTSAAAVSPAASAGETVGHYADMMAARTRIKIVVTTGGTLRIDEHSKAQA